MAAYGASGGAASAAAGLFQHPAMSQVTMATGGQPSPTYPHAGTSIKGRLSFGGGGGASFQVPHARTKKG